jgi:hypothetical protein
LEVVDTDVAEIGRCGYRCKRSLEDVDKDVAEDWRMWAQM